MRERAGLLAGQQGKIPAWQGRQPYTKGGDLLLGWAVGECAERIVLQQLMLADAFGPDHMLLQGIAQRAPL